VRSKIDNTKELNKLPEAIRKAFMEYFTKVFEDQVRIVEIQL
jgi:alanyl-tRNA synthetase